MPRAFASRLGNLGTETAYAVSLEAAAARATGQTVFDFHIGDLNFPTPSLIVDATKKALDEGKTGYVPAAGINPLREAVADFVGKRRGVTYTKDEVAIQPGGKPIINKFLLSVMEPGDEVLYPTPGYPIYESLIGFYGGIKKPYSYRETSDGFVLDIEEIKSLITPKTKLFIYNNYQNPTGSVSSQKEMQQIAEICVKHDLWVLSDEAYYDLVYGQQHGESIVALPGMKERTVILLTCSKSWAMTGWRLGAAIGPKDLISWFIKLATNDEACVTQFVQWGAIPAFNGECEAEVAAFRNELQKRRDLIVQKVKSIPGFQATSPKSTFYLLVNVSKAIKMVGLKNTEEFRKYLLEKTGVSVCTRDHFGFRLPSEDQHYIRFAFSSVTIPIIEKAFDVLQKHMDSIASSVAKL